MRTPSICVLLLVFRGLHATATLPDARREISHLGRGKRCLWQGRVKQQARHLATCDADPGAQTSLNRRCAGGRSGVQGRARGLAGGPCAIDIEHHPMVSLSIPQPAWLLRFFQRASREIFEKQRTSCFELELDPGPRESDWVLSGEA